MDLQTAKDYIEELHAERAQLFARIRELKTQLRQMEVWSDQLMKDLVNRD